ncbi:MAG: hypothetical protein ACRDSH_08840 [Pseudonocardiaceae bacterium]
MATAADVAGYDQAWTIGVQWMAVPRRAGSGPAHRAVAGSAWQADRAPPRAGLEK